MVSNSNVSPESRMDEILAAYPGAQRALFRGYHIGGCSSCAFQPEETLAELCARNNGLDVEEVLQHIRDSHEQDLKIFISPGELRDLRNHEPDLPLLDVRSREEFDAVKIEGAVFLNQESMQKFMGLPEDQLFVIVDHKGKQGLDAAAYFIGHGNKNVRVLDGGIDAWSSEIDSSLPRYEFS